MKDVTRIIDSASWLGYISRMHQRISITGDIGGRGARSGVDRHTPIAHGH
jgi:hypothetical protein